TDTTPTPSAEPTTQAAQPTTQAAQPTTQAAQPTTQAAQPTTPAAPAEGALTVSDNNAGTPANADIAYIPVSNTRTFSPSSLDRTVGSGLRIRNTDTKLNSKFLIHSPEGAFEDMQVNPNYDMYVMFNAPGTYKFELYSFDATVAAGGTLTPFGSAPSVLTVTVE
ncbi:MAG: hypothetical protein II940_03885, partial [Methanosarcinaceae archaeon]|nr:hypothetical protein [Methanosarcinaceae archaeon]